MARKKTAETASLKAAPVLRASGGGDDPSPVTPTITKSYSIRDDWKDSGIVNYVAFKSVDGEVQDLTVNGEPAGGGGGSLAITEARIDIIDTNHVSAVIMGVMKPLGDSYAGNVISDDPDAAFILAKLTDGVGTYYIAGMHEGSATGNITLRADENDPDGVSWWVFVQGPGTITISA